MSAVHSFETTILRRIAAKGQDEIAKVIDYSPTKVSRFLSNQEGLKLETFALLLNAIGLSLLESDGETVTLSRDEYNALRCLTRKAVSE